MLKASKIGSTLYTCGLCEIGQKVKGLLSNSNQLYASCSTLYPNSIASGLLKNLPLCFPSAKTQDLQRSDDILNLHEFKAENISLTSYVFQIKMYHRKGLHCIKQALNVLDWNDIYKFKMHLHTSVWAMQMKILFERVSVLLFLLLKPTRVI